MSQGIKKPLTEAQEVAIELLQKLSPFCHQIMIAGSIRRGKPMVGDIELVAVPICPKDLFGEPIKDANDKLSAFLASKEVPMILDGDRLKRFRYRGLAVDLFIVRPDEIGRLGWRVILSTGSHDFNKWLVTKQDSGGAMPPNMKADKGWLWVEEPGKWPSKLEARDEIDVFSAFGLPFIPAEDRDQGRWYKYAEAWVEMKEGG